MASLLQKYRLLKGLLDGERAGTGPFYVTLDLTRRCNLHCLGCRFHATESADRVSGDPRVRDFPLQWAERLFEDLRQLRTRTLFLMGEGEPFLYPRLFDVIRIAKRYGLRTTVTTNGTLFDEERVSHILDARLDEIHVSLWTSGPEDYVKQYPGTNRETFERVLRGLRLLSSRKERERSRSPRIVLTCPLNRLNYRQADRMVDLAEQVGCNAVSFTPFKTNRGQFARYALSRQEEGELRERMVGLRKRLRAKGLGDNVGRLLARYAFGAGNLGGACYIHWFHSRIRVDGTIYSCGRSERALGSLRKERFAEIWNGEAYRAERRRMLSPDGAAYRNSICDCEHCGYVLDSMAIRRGLGYLEPLLAILGAGSTAKREREYPD